MRALLRAVIYGMPFAYMGFIWYLSSCPSDAVIYTGLPFDALLKETLHLIEFAFLYLLWVLFFMARGNLSRKLNLLAAALAVLYGFVDEAHQYFVPSRSATVIDLIKNTAGVAAAWYFVDKALFHDRSSGLGRVLVRIGAMSPPNQRHSLY